MLTSAGPPNLTKPHSESRSKEPFKALGLGLDLVPATGHARSRPGASGHRQVGNLTYALWVLNY